MAAVRTIMAQAFNKLVIDTKGQRLDDVGRRVVRQVLTNEARGVGKKFVERPKMDKTKLSKKVKEQTAESAGNVGVIA